MRRRTTRRWRGRVGWSTWRRTSRFHVGVSSHVEVKESRSSATTHPPGTRASRSPPCSPPSPAHSRPTWRGPPNAPGAARLSVTGKASTAPAPSSTAHRPPRRHRAGHRRRVRVRQRPAVARADHAGNVAVRRSRQRDRHRPGAHSPTPTSRTRADTPTRLRRGSTPRRGWPSSATPPSTCVSYARGDWRHPRGRATTMDA